MLEVNGLVPREDARRMQRDADALVLVDFDARVEGMVTGKVFDYLSVTAPILVIGGSSGSAIDHVVSTSGRGVHLAGDRPRIRSVIRDLLDGRAVLPGPPNTEFIKTLSRTNQSMLLRALMRELVTAS